MLAGEATCPAETYPHALARYVMVISEGNAVHAATGASRVALHATVDIALQAVPRTHADVTAWQRRHHITLDLITCTPPADRGRHVEVKRAEVQPSGHRAANSRRPPAEIYLPAQAFSCPGRAAA